MHSTNIHTVADIRNTYSSIFKMTLQWSFLVLNFVGVWGVVRYAIQRIRNCAVVFIPTFPPAWDHTKTHLKLTLLGYYIICMYRRLECRQYTPYLELGCWVCIWHTALLYIIVPIPHTIRISLNLVSESEWPPYAFLGTNSHELMESDQSGAWSNWFIPVSIWVKVNNITVRQGLDAVPQC